MDDSLKKEIPADYTSEFEFSETGSEFGSGFIPQNESISTCQEESFYKKPKTIKSNVTDQMKKEQYEKDYMKHQTTSLRAHLLTMDGFTRHKKLVNDYLALHGGLNNETKNEDSPNNGDSVKDQQRFIWHEGDECESWGSRLAKKYWHRLFKEYCLIDLSRYQQNKYGMRWRLEKEVIAGKGQFICANDNCEVRDDLRSWEVKFNYVEKGEKRTALVKVRLCGDCSRKLNHNHQRKEVTRAPRKRKLILPIPLDDDVLDRDSLSSSSLDEIKTTMKRARKESSRSLTEDEDETGSSGAESSQTNPDSSSVTLILQQQPLSVDSCPNSVTSSGPPSPLSVGSQSEDESTMIVGSGIKLSKKKSSFFREEEFDKYFDDLLL